MDWLGTILSSAVIVAVISFLAGEKENRLKYITAERTEWRKEIKSITSKLSECQTYGKKARRLLTDLKLRINSYGKRKEYSSDICLQFFSDEHIWKEISMIEQGDEFAEHRDRLLRYLELSLKFDWEKSKNETKTEQKPIVLSIIYMLTVIISTYLNYAVIKEKTINNNWILMLQEESFFILCQFIPLVIFLLPLFDEYIGFSSKEESYNKNALDFMCFTIGEILLGVFWIIAAVFTDRTIYYFLGCLQIVLGLPFFLQAVDRKKIYRDYSNSVMACYTDEPIQIYSGDLFIQNVISMLEIEPEFNNRGIAYKRIYNLEIIKEEDAKELLKGWKYASKYKKLKKENKELTEKEFLTQYPKACKIFVKRGNEIIVGRAPKEWKRLAVEISQIERGES